MFSVYVRCAVHVVGCSIEAIYYRCIGRARHTHIVFASSQRRLYLPSRLYLYLNFFFVERENGNGSNSSNSNDGDDDNDRDVYLCLRCYTNTLLWPVNRWHGEARPATVTGPALSVANCERMPYVLRTVRAVHHTCSPLWHNK